MHHRIGLIGASWIAPQAIIDPASILPNAEISAVAGRNRDRVETYAAVHGIPKFYDAYEMLLADPDIDIVYLSLPPSHHAIWSIKALEAGKHVICEKPLAMNVAEAQAMVVSAKQSGKRLIEAFHSYYHPAFQICLDWVRPGKIGDLKSIRAHFGVGFPDDGMKNQYRPELGGGTIMDMGCYPLFWARHMIGTPIVDANVDVTVAASGVDDTMTSHLTFQGGVSAHISSAMTPTTPFEAFMEIDGTAGHIRFDNPLSPHQEGKLMAISDDESVEAPVSTVTTYCYQLQAILNALDSGKKLATEGEEILAQQQGIDLLYDRAGLAHLRASTHFQ